MERIKQLLAERQDNRSYDEIVKAAFATVNPVIKAVFDDMPQVNIICVQAYTPFWCDGDVCKFRISCSVDWFNRDDVYYSPVYFDGYVDEEDKTEYAGLFSKKDPGYEGRKSDPDYDNLMMASSLIITLEDEFKILDRENGTWWVFVRDEEAPNGFSVKSDTFEHD